MTPGPSDNLSALMAGTPYRAIARMAKGGMGDVLEVEHELLGRRFVAKLLHANLSADPGFLERVRVEAQSTARLRHPHIVDITDFCITAAGQPCLVMEKLHGRTLRREVAELGPLPVADCLQVVDELLSALAAAHRLGVVHRDIKPDNLFLHEAVGGCARRLKVLDFGLARVMPGAPAVAPLPSSVATATGRVVGSPGYVSPEALMGRVVDHRADLYAAGLILFFTLTGRGPFDHLSLEATLSHAPTPPSQLRDAPGVRELDGVLAKALKKVPEERYQSAVEFTSDLASLSRRTAVS